MCRFIILLSLLLSPAAFGRTLVYHSMQEFLQDYNHRLSLVRQDRNYVRTWHQDLESAEGVNSQGQYDENLDGFITDTRSDLGLIIPDLDKGCNAMWMHMASPDGFALSSNHDLKYKDGASLWQFTKVMQALGCGRTPSQAFWDSIR